MTDVLEIAEAAPVPKSRGKLGLIVGIVAALGLGGGGFYAVYAGLLDPGKILGGGDGGGHGTAEGPSVVGDIAFVALDPIMISLAPGASAKHLRFSGQLEVDPAHAAEVTALMPRVLDVLNTYLRAVDVKDLEAPAALARLRAQMLRRIQVVTGEGMVKDLLVTEFVLN
ncbi:MAG: flagellar basal body-associated FliL family protein [Amaricoccus sp.]